MRTRFFGCALGTCALVASMTLVSGAVGAVVSDGAVPAKPRRWGPERPIITHTRVESPEPDVVVTGTGLAVAVWTARTKRFGADHVYASVRRPGHRAWGPPVQLSGKPDTFDADVTVSGPDSVTVAYQGFQARDVVVATRSLTGSGWSPATEVARWRGHVVTENLDLGSNRSGDQVVAWRKGRQLKAAYKPRTEGWGHRVTLATDASTADAWVNSDGEADLVGEARSGDRLSLGVVWHRSASGNWTRERFGRAKRGRQVEITSSSANAQGDLAVAWERTLHSGGFICPCAAAVRYRPAGERFKPTRKLEKSGEANAQVALGPGGVATLVWQHRSPSRIELNVARLGAGPGWIPLGSIAGRPRPTPCCDQPRPLQVKVNRHGGAYLAFADIRNGAAVPRSAVVAVRCAAGSPCGPLHVLPKARISAVRLAVEPRGGATFVWRDDCRFDPVIEECEYRSVTSRRLEPVA